MPANLFEIAESCLYASSVEAKLEATEQAARIYREKGFSVDDHSLPKPASEVCFPEHPKLVDPKHLPRRKLTTAAGQIAFLHAIAHIEFTAIQLAWDMVYRFRGMPPAFYDDWLEVAIEEAFHFSLLRGRLRDFDADYGQFPAHRGLWELAEDTAHDVKARLALVPRVMEARGLDVTPSMIAKLDAVGDDSTANILKIILRDEVGHVARGTRWFQYVCNEQGVDPMAEYFSLVERYLRGAVRGPFNTELRRAAGFTDFELERLEAMATESPARIE
ncbi:ferritin-like domain-containing protein [Methylocaldum sp.]|uniref:ferritin-like domain-containing protein n=1 Tax=Methylocaldum sp. TaxID=1969727 RepID=UPI002D359B92|nr:ferritin-like domain-containing protein [Methylocaldum sp.]HYE36476.1 ferritin-like domain-containing protein [Methylocaldum sp.]